MTENARGIEVRLLEAVISLSAASNSRMRRGVRDGKVRPGLVAGLCNCGVLHYILLSHMTWI